MKLDATVMVATFVIAWNSHTEYPDQCQWMPGTNLEISHEPDLVGWRPEACLSWEFVREDFVEKVANMMCLKPCFGMTGLTVLAAADCLHSDEATEVIVSLEADFRQDS